MGGFDEGLLLMKIVLGLVDKYEAVGGMWLPLVMVVVVVANGTDTR